MNLLYILQASLIIYFSFLIGKKSILWLHLTFPRKTETFYSIVLGFGWLGLIALIFSLFSLYNIASFWVLFALVVVLSKETVSSHIKLICSSDFYKNLFLKSKLWLAEYTILKIIILAFVLMYFLLSLLPSLIYGDGIAFHLPIILKIIDDGRMSIPLLGPFTLEPNLSYGYIPVLAELIYSIPILLFKSFGAFRIIQLSALFILIRLLIEFTSKKFKNGLSATLLSIVLLSCMPLTKLALEGGMVEIFTMLFGILSTLLLVQMIVDDLPPKETILASAILVAFSASTKYIGLFYGVLNGLLLLYYFYNQKFSVKKTFKNLLFYALPPILIAGFWYIKNLVYLGNPVFPMLSAEYKEFANSVYCFVFEPSLWRFPLLPFSLFGQGMTFKLPFAFLVAVYFAGSYLMTIYLLFKKNLSKLEVILLALAEVYLLLMLYTTHQLRFAIPAIVLICILFVLQLDKIIDSYKKIQPFYRISIVLVSIALFGGAALSLKTEILCLVGHTDKTTCAAKATRSTLLIYQASDYINQNLKDTKVIEYRNAYNAFSLTNGNVYVREDCGLLGDLSGKEVVIKQCLKENNIEYLLDDTEARGKNKYPVTEYFYKNANIIFERHDSERNTFMRLLKLR
jgi:hypothetical protein